MVIVILALLIYILKCKFEKLSPKGRNNILICFLFGIFIICIFNLYVEYCVGWKYGVPFDDDSSWIFKAAESMKKGSKWSELYLLVSRSWDLTNRVLSPVNIGQYIYAKFVSLCLYYPVIIDLHVNIYILYLIQFTLITIAIIDMILELEGIGKAYYKKIPSKSIVFFLILFYPMIIFNAGKMLRETIYTYFMFEMFACFLHYLNNAEAKEKMKKIIIYALLMLLFRPNSVMIVVPLFIWMFLGDEMAVIINLIIMGIVTLGTLIVNWIMQMVGWSYSFGNVSIYETIHLVLFPNIFNQIKDFMYIFSEPSWQTVVYFFQSFWNIIFIVIMVVGMVFAKNKKYTLVFLTMLLNALFIYSIAYGVENFTPRYKLIYIIPQIYFVYTGLCFMKSKFKLR